MTVRQNYVQVTTCISECNDCPDKGYKPGADFEQMICVRNGRFIGWSPLGCPDADVKIPDWCPRGRK